MQPHINFKGEQQLRVRGSVVGSERIEFSLKILGHRFFFEVPLPYEGDNTVCVSVFDREKDEKPLFTVRGIVKEKEDNEIIVAYLNLLFTSLVIIVPVPDDEPSVNENGEPVLATVPVIIKESSLARPATRQQRRETNGVESV